MTRARSFRIVLGVVLAAGLAASCGGTDSGDDDAGAAGTSGAGGGGPSAGGRGPYAGGGGSSAAGSETGEGGAGQGVGGAAAGGGTAAGGTSSAGSGPAGGASGQGSGGAGADGASGASSGGKAGAAGGGGKGGGKGGAGQGGAGAAGQAGGPAAGNPNGHCDIPDDAKAEDVSKPTTVVGKGTAASCTGDAVVQAVAGGGVITFDCGPDPVTITLSETAKVFNDKGPKVVIDGGGKVTLSGGGKVRILYQDTCDQAQHWTTSHCDNQDSPALTVQNLTFAKGNATGQLEEGGGGGAILARGGRLKVVNSRFFANECDPAGPDLGGASVRTLSQYNGLPVYVVNSTFGASGEGNSCSNGGGLSSIGVSYTVINSLFQNNTAVGNGANPAQPGTPGGGSGGAIYNDGNTYTLSLCGVDIEDNVANEGGGAIFFVSNDKTGSLVIKDSTLKNNTSKGFQNYPGIFFLGKGAPQIVNSTVQ